MNNIHFDYSNGHVNSLINIMLYKLPIPKSPEIFENLICDLINASYKTTSFNLFGRRGQNQNGIDIISNEFKTIVQCKLRSINLNNRKTKITFIKEVLEDVNSILKNSQLPERIIIATTIENDTLVQDYLQSISFLNNLSIIFEFWSWSKISSEIFLFPNILAKYYPFRNDNIEIGRLEVLNKRIYRKSKQNELLYEFQNLKNKNHLPIFDFSFINNTENTILLNSIDCFCTHQAVVRAGSPAKPAGILKPTKKFIIDLKFNESLSSDFEKFTLEMKDPIYINPKSPFRIQLQNKKPIINFLKIYFTFNFNLATIKTPELYFNSFTTFSGKIITDI
ncbi:hypothetical protein [Chryseobacterium caseinilyticum]|uniref:Restriction endonuclease type IV Mrr domain-containing protein n=1 Tax=Chryseobacterium caseinilyticum TaxID=2771428 RepID=A0ABR8ZGV5_9FLAO|nr:hypothetical protein [Chryseobacterium caseinilyticum]MBD8084530.1 hypothetical protein [Chryseobacterium caseinilyticum]